MAKVANEVLAGKIDDTRARSFGYLVQVLLTAHALSDVEDGLRQLEEAGK